MHKRGFGVRVLYRVLVALLCLVSLPVWGAPPTLDRFFPAGIQRGEQANVTAEGKFDNWPIKVWSETAGLDFEVLKEKGKLRVQAAEGLPCGVHWVRFYDARGASALRPLVVGSSAEQLEVEPNETIDKAQVLELPTTLNGRLQKTGDVDTYCVQLEADDKLVVSMGANTRFGSPMDGVLQIVSSAGFVIEQNDDSKGIDPLVIFTVPATGKYYIRAFGFPETPTQQIAFGGGPAFVYRLAVTASGFLDHSLPLAISSEQSDELNPFGWNLPAAGPPLVISDCGTRPVARVFHPDLHSSLSLPRVECANLVVDLKCGLPEPHAFALPVMLSGRIEEADDVDVFEFSASKGQEIEVQVEAEAIGSLLDPQLTLVDDAGKVIAEADDSRGKQRDCVLKQKLESDGTFRLLLRDAFDHGGFRYFYRMSVQNVRPDFQLSVAADSVVVEGETPVEVTVTVDRRDGFKLPIEIAAVDLPEFVDATAATSESEGDTSKSVKLKLSAGSGVHSGLFRIRGTAMGEESERRYATFKINRPEREVERLWLTVRAAENRKTSP
jgi:hypothetical protein